MSDTETGAEQIFLLGTAADTAAEEEHVPAPVPES